MEFEDIKEKENKNIKELKVSWDKQNVKNNLERDFSEIDYTYVGRLLALLAISNCFLSYFLLAFFSEGLIFLCKLFLIIISTFVAFLTSVGSVYEYLKYRNKDFRKAKGILLYVFFSLLSLGFVCALWIPLFFRIL